MSVPGPSSVASPPPAGARVDRIGVALALLIGIPSLAYPLSYDQALFDYVGKTWASGGLPYVDAVDHKPPAAFWASALSHAALGGAPWGVRLLDLLCVVITGALVGRILQDGRPSRGEIGASALLLSVMYYTLYDFPNTAQVESYQALCLAAAWGVALRPGRSVGVGVGALVGLATLLKFTAVIPALLPLGLALKRAWGGGGARAAARALVLAGVGFGGVWTLGLAPFFGPPWATTWEVLYEFNLAYGGQGRFEAMAHLRPWLKDAALYTVLGWGPALVWGVLSPSAARVRGGQALGLVALSHVAIGVQGRYSPYHELLALPFVVALFVWGWWGVTGVRWPRAASAVAGLCVLGLVLPPAFPQLSWLDYPRWVAHLARCQWEGCTPPQRLAPLTNPYGLGPALEWELGQVIAAAARPGDTLWVKARQPELYATSGLTSPTRFFNLGFTGMAEFKDRAWSREVAQVLSERPATFVVVFEGDTLIPALLRGGYSLLRDGGKLEVYARGLGPADGGAPSEGGL